ncbi:alginate lyase [Dyadobacter jejuensis]|uniref:Alginate lyase n=1 Tax=Dyadobacter jejuensis TaxID=1082580 RepID=A0A316AM03_9BACT|nr:alginate lyase family protein [Dyadobacter jejuensis]PWJ58458.1 alginate lyase [Dyadobacter jejuensis]
MRLFYLGFCMLLGLSGAVAQRGSVLMDPSDASQIQQSLGQFALLDKSYEDLKQLADGAIAQPMDVPVPKDPAGGYSHEQHKRNYQAIQAAGICYSVSKDQRYVKFVKDILLQYSRLIPTLKNHPQAKGSSPGRLFHQALNDCNWVAYSVQGYDAVYSELTPAERSQIESSVFRPLATFLTRDLESWFNLVHNHGVWAVSAVGMTGFVLKDKELVEKAILGTKKDGKGGFLAQLNTLFSPDGYYTEGPYYVRYALLPFFLFAQAIEMNQPERKIFDYRNQILKKAFYAALQQTNSDGKFIPINDALKEKGWDTRELVTAASIVFQRYGADATLLDMIRQQGRVLLNKGGLAIAKLDKQLGSESPHFERKSVIFSDGPMGRDGGIAILRNGVQQQQTSLVFKFTGHGLSHGHYDKLMLALYDDGNEILTDYGAARFLNVEPKFGGRYLPENHSFAMQTIAHNTVVVDEASHFGGKEAVAEKESGQLYFADLSDANQQIISAKAATAYKDVTLQRTLLMLNDSTLDKPIVLDLFRVLSAQKHQYDLPFYYKGQLIKTNLPYQAATKVQTTLGESNGYQHLWKQAEAKPNASAFTLTWLNDSRFYSVTTATDTATQVILARVGANDPDFNLRPEPALIVRQQWAKGGTFLSVIEPHGHFDPTAETASGAESNVKEAKIIYDTAVATVVDVWLNSGHKIRLAVANNDAASGQSHSLSLPDGTLSWKGYYQLNLL